MDTQSVNNNCTHLSVPLVQNSPALDKNASGDFKVYFKTAQSQTIEPSGAKSPILDNSVGNFKNTQSSFNILNHIGKLEPAKEKNKYICPCCGDDNLGIHPVTGAYNCFSNGCDPEDIREAIAPWRDKKADNHRITQTPRKPKAVPKPVLVPEGTLTLARLPQPVELPQARRIGDRLETIYPYSDSQWVARTDLPSGKKEIRPWHVDVEGEEIEKKGGEPWPAYRIAEVQAYAVGQWALGMEGEKCVEASRWLGLVGFTLQGGWNKEELLKTVAAIKGAGVAGIAYYPDHDDAGRNKAEKMAIAAQQAGIPFVRLDPTLIWSQCPEKGDIADWIMAFKDEWSKEEFVARLEAQFNAAAEREREAADLREGEEECPSKDPAIRAEFTQSAFNAFFQEDPWICASGVLYQWQGNYYKRISDDSLIRRIADFCDSYPVESKKGVVAYPFARPSFVRMALDWCKMKLTVDPTELDPPGLNCINGILQLQFGGTHKKPTVSYELVPHSPDFYYVYEPLAKYDPLASSIECDRLLQCLEPQYRDIFLKTLAAALDVKNIRKYKGRLVKLIFFYGDGNNGKDALRSVSSAVFGHQGFTGFSIEDFVSYDAGRKFPLAGLINSRVNWASENASFTRIDNIQSLKLFATGDGMYSERKGKDPIFFNPLAVGIFHINKNLKVDGALEAILSRVCVIPLLKNYKINADPVKGEIEADPRFKEDPDFIAREVLPAFLNKILNALTLLLDEGIDYSPLKEAFEDAQASSSHLVQFCREAGLAYGNGFLSASDIWKRLERWYEENGTLVVDHGGYGGKQIRTWNEQAAPGDRNITAINQVLSRFSHLFPKAKRASIPHPNDGKRKIQILQGIVLARDGGNSDNTPPDVPTPPTPDPHHHPHQETLINQGSHTTHTKFSTREKNEDFSEPCPESTNFSRNDDFAPQALTSTLKNGAGGVGVPHSKENWCGSGVGDGVDGVGDELPAVDIAIQTLVEEFAGKQIELPMHQRSDGGFVATTMPQSEPEPTPDPIELLAKIMADEKMIPNADELAELRKQYPAGQLKEAAKQLDPKRHDQIREWVTQLNAAATRKQAGPQPIEKPKPAHLANRISDTRLDSGEAIGSCVQILSAAGSIYPEVHTITGWNEANGLYRLSNGELIAPFQLTYLLEAF